MMGCKKNIFYLLLTFMVLSCGNKTKGGAPTDTIALKAAPVFEADTAYAFVVQQCAFGARTPGSTAHQRCGDWLMKEFKRFGCEVSEQKTIVKGYDGSSMPCRNIIAHLATTEANAPTMLLTAHWDSRFWADNDADEALHHTPVLAANDGASGVAVMLEMARVLNTTPQHANIDFICFDVEDQGTPEFAEEPETDSPMGFWCLGSRYWAEQAFVNGYRARWAINLDMVGGKGTRFKKEGISLHYASGLVKMVWTLAQQLGYGAYFVDEEGGMVTDDHLPVNQTARIPAINIVPNVEGRTSSFGATWHTHNDTPENIDPQVMKAVGQTLVQLVILNS